MSSSPFLTPGHSRSRRALAARRRRRRRLTAVGALALALLAALIAEMAFASRSGETSHAAARASHSRTPSKPAPFAGRPARRRYMRGPCVGSHARVSPANAYLRP